MKNKCLVVEAREKCQCKDCKQYRKFRDILIKQQADIEAIKIWKGIKTNKLK
jgi:hypothetical protein